MVDFNKWEWVGKMNQTGLGNDEKWPRNSLLYTAGLLEDFLKETVVKITLKLENTRRLQEWVIFYENNLLKA